MTSLLSYLITIFAFMFWVFRIIVTYTASMSIDFGILPLNLNTEIILLFITLFCLILIVKRNIVGAIIYLVAYGAYFGVDVYQTLNKILEGQTGMMDYTTLFVSFVGIAIAFVTFIDIGINKNRMGSTKNKETDWFYEDKKYERELDERVDKNQYKF